MAVSQDAHCIYQFSLNSRIHKFVFQRSDEQAIDEFLGRLRQIFDEYTEDDPLLILVDLRPDGIPPFNYTLFEARKLFSEHTVPPIRAAYIYTHSPFLSIIKRFFALLRINSTRRFYQGDKESEAVDWLLERES